METINQQIGKILDKELQLDMPRPVKAKMEVVRQITALIQSEYVEKDFVLWLQLNCNSSGHYWILKTDYPRDMFSWKSINDMHDHWLKEVKEVKQ